MKTQFELRLEELINEYSMENGSDTPDFILARYLRNCLENFDASVKEREEWYGRQKHISDLPEDVPFPTQPPIDYDSTGTPPDVLPSTTNIDLDSQPLTDLES